jgi:tRNA-dihydrouridine synthase
VAAVKKLQAIKDDYDFIDVNLGCPMPKVTGPGPARLG